MTAALPESDPAAATLAMFSSMLDAARSGVGFLDRELRYVRVNPVLAALNGLAADAHAGRPLGSTLFGASDAIERLVRRVFETGQAVRDHAVDLATPPAPAMPVRLMVTLFPVPVGGAIPWVGVIAADVTERERAAHALALSEERFRLAARAARDVVWDWDLARDTVTTVGGAARVFGFEEAEVGSSSAWWREQLHPDDRDRVLASIAAAAEHGDVWAEEYRHRRADGRYAVVVDRAYVVRGEDGRAVRMVGVTTDVTGEREAARILAASEARFRSVFESRMIGIGFWGAGRVWEANDELLRLLGYTRAELEAGIIVTERLTPPDMRPRDLAAMRELESRDSVTPYEKEFLRKDGSRIPVLVGGARYEAPPVSGVFFVLDNTELGRMREQAQAAQRMEMVGQLAGGVAHEVNNALQGVLGFSEFVMRSLASGTVRRGDVEQIRHSAERAARITRQLLAFSRRQLLRPAVLDLGAVVNGFEPMLRQALGTAAELELAAAPEPVLVSADVGQLEQVLLNLALNARDAMPAGGKLRVRVASAALGPADVAGLPDSPRAGPYGLLEVADTGIGMSDAVRARLFEPFFTTKPPGKGTGLGLSVVYGIVRQSDGFVTCDSAPGSGAVFRIHLPLAAPAP